MNYTNLNKLYWIKLDIETIKQELEEISYLGFAPMDNMPHSTEVGNPVDRIVQKKLKLENKLNKKLDKYYEERETIENYIETIDDISIQVIAKRRFILNETWESIEKAVHYDRSCCYRKLMNYINRGKEE